MRFATMLTTLLGATALCVATQSAAAPCASNEVCIAQEGCSFSTAPSQGRGRSYTGGIYVSSAYDWVAGTCGSSSQQPGHSPSPIVASVDAHDDFFVTGVAPGTPLVIHARIRVVGLARALAYHLPSNHSTAWLEEADAGRVEAVVSAVNLDPPMDIDEIRTLDFANVAGETFRLSMGAESSSEEGQTYANLSLSFTDIPPGAVIQSCQGFNGGQPVPTYPATWGSLKLRYH